MQTTENKRVSTWQVISHYFSLVTFSHTLFALPFAVIGFFLAIRTEFVVFNWLQFVFMLLCMVFARNAAMGFNRYIDRTFDAKNPRTKSRELPIGTLAPSAAILFVIINSVLFIGCAWFINQLCFYLSPLALLVVLGYSLTKRFTALCHLVLGLGLSLAPIGAYLAVTAHFAVLPVLYSITVLCWVSGFDIIYALQDVSFDRQQGLHSIPAMMGVKRALVLARIFHAVAFVAVLFPIFLISFTWAYYVGVAFFGAMLLWQHRLVKPYALSKVDKAFFTTNGLASVVFALFFLLDAWLKLSHA